jgi:Trk K+ transport system NAD-binding subunit
VLYRTDTLQLAEFEVESSSYLEQKSLADAFKGLKSVTVLGIRKIDNSFDIGPRGNTVLAAGDHLILMAEEDTLWKVSAQAKTSPTPD